MGQEVLSLGEFLPKGLGKSDQPFLCSPITLVHGATVFIVDINAIQLVLLDEGRKGARKLRGVFTLRCRILC